MSAPEIEEISDDRQQKNDSNIPASTGNRKSGLGWIALVRLVVGSLVIAAITYTAITSATQLRESEIRFGDVNYICWLAALLVYIGTMWLSCLFWHRVLVALGQQPEFGRSLLAFFASQLGKYVPGKAMVVVIRTDMIRGEQVKTAPAAASVFVETLTWIFVGSAIASLLLVFQFKDQLVLQITALTLTLVAGMLTWPAVFRRIAQTLIKSRGGNHPDLFAGLNLSTMSFGWSVMTLGWALNGLSLWLVILGIPGSDIGPGDFPLTLACITLATVAGFVSLLPGGIGVRELVMIPLLGARFGPVIAIVAAIAIRIVWLAAELATSGIIYVYRRMTR